MRKRLGWSLGLFLAGISLPYLLAAGLGQGHVFGGFLLNPLDGNTYLAKMYAGWSGAWQFSLPFTAEKGQGTFLFMFYLFLGQFSRLTGLSLLLTFHLARLLGAGVLVYALIEFATWAFGGPRTLAWRAWQLALWGSGSGWVVMFAGWATSDLWVAETYPFLASFTNPHFSLGMGLLLLILMGLDRAAAPRDWLYLAAEGLLLAILMPFGIVVAGIMGGLWLAWEWFATRQLRWQPFLAAFCLGGPAIVYQYVVTLTDPLLSQWNAQNVTPSPHLWDLIVALSPALLLAGWGAWRLARQAKRTTPERLLLVWFVAGLALIYVPFSLQRRFMFAYYIPVAFLAVAGLRELPHFARKLQKDAYPLLMIASLVTNGMVLFLAGYGIMTTAPQLYLARDEAAAFEFIRTALPPDALILCPPETGNRIPAWTGRRVLYGHEFETVNAAENKALVERLYSAQLPASEAAQLIQQHQIGYVWVGVGETGGIGAELKNRFRVIYQNDTIQLYARP